MKDAWKAEKWWRNLSFEEADALMHSAWDDGYHESPDFCGSDDDAFQAAFILYPRLRSIVVCAEAFTEAWERDDEHALVVAGQRLRDAVRLAEKEGLSR